MKPRWLALVGWSPPTENASSSTSIPKEGPPMANDEITAKLQSLQAQVLATQFAVRVLLASAPHVATAIRDSSPHFGESLLAFDLKDGQIEEAVRTIRLLAEPLE
jgi:hypothetical protein